MVTGPPEYCPACGGAVTMVEARSVYRCHSCDDLVFHEPSPTARVVVVDGDRALLVEIPDEARLADPPAEDEREWMTPGGHIDLGEQPAEAAVRELEEETGLRAAATDLVLFDAVTRQVIPDHHSLALLYAVPASATTGTLRAATDAADARFWRPAELAASACVYRTLHAEPEGYRAFEGLLGRARTALADAE